MNNRERITVLEEQHKRLDNAVAELEKLRETDRTEDMKFKITDLKKKKLSIKDEITLLQRDENNKQETFDFGEYRHEVL